MPELLLCRNIFIKNERQLFAGGHGIRPESHLMNGVLFRRCSLGAGSDPCPLTGIADQQSFFIERKHGIADCDTRNSEHFFQCAFRRQKRFRLRIFDKQIQFCLKLFPQGFFRIRVDSKLFPDFRVCHGKPFPVSIGITSILYGIMLSLSIGKEKIQGFFTEKIFFLWLLVSYQNNFHQGRMCCLT